MKTKTVAVVAMLALGLDACASIRSARDRVVRPPSCADLTVQIYFDPDSAEVTRDGQAVLDLGARDARACRIDGVEVLGLADSAGAPAANLELSRRRAQAVAQALTAAGLPSAEFKVGAAGQAGAIDARGDARPLRRRTDVVLRLSSGR